MNLKCKKPSSGCWDVTFHNLKELKELEYDETALGKESTHLREVQTAKELNKKNTQRPRTFPYVIKIF